MKVLVLGSGGWGTALANLLAENDHSVTLWSFLPEEAAALAKMRINSFLPGVRLHDCVAVTSDLSAAVGHKLILMVTPSFAVRKTAEHVKCFLDEDAVFVSATKGIEPGTSMLMSQIIETVTGKRVAALSGPSHAEEVGRRIPTGCVVACPDRKIAEMVQDVFMNERFRVYTSPDITGTELSAALKNIIALCAGICDGLRFGDNTKALLMTRGLAELSRLGEKLGGRSETFFGLAGIGDLIVTCTSMHSRNRRAGILIGQGKTPEEAMREVGAVVEGYYAIQSAIELAHKTGTKMPITEEAYAILYKGADPMLAVSSLMSREKQVELEY